MPRNVGREWQKHNTKWARGVLKSLDWVKRCYTTAKREMNPTLYEELTCNFWAQNLERNDPELWSNYSWIHSSKQIYI